MRLPRRNRGAVTLAELLIVIAILALLFIIAAWNWRNQIGRGYDARRKSDLARIKIAFEDYYNDKECYPPSGTLDDCGGPGLKPYMPEIPCDPTKRIPYVYIVDDDDCHSYRVLAALEDESDPDIGRVGCSVGGGCGYYETAYNWGISSGESVFGIVEGPGSTPTITPPITPPSGPVYACTPGGACNIYANPGGVSNCPVWWIGACPEGACSVDANRCEF